MEVDSHDSSTLPVLGDGQMVMFSANHAIASAHEDLEIYFDILEQKFLGDTLSYTRLIPSDNIICTRLLQVKGRQQNTRYPSADVGTRQLQLLGVLLNLSIDTRGQNSTI